MHFDIEEIRSRLREADPDQSYDTGEALRALAHPRFTGTEGAARARAEVRSRLEALGYHVKALPFTFSAWPGRYAQPLAGGLLLLAATLALALLGAGLPLTALVLLVLFGALVVGVAYGAPRAIQGLPWGRVEGENLLALPDECRPRWLVVAHVDSKSQMLPLALRTAGPAAAVLGWVGLVVVAALAAGGMALEPWLVWLLGGVAVLGGLLTLLTWPGNASAGALDNASGVAALLAVAAAERAAGDVGFLITDAEELGLAGARAVTPHLPRVAGAINLDGLDDHGTLHVVERYGWPPRGLASHLAAALMSAAVALDEPVRRRDLPLGILLDHVALAGAGVPALSLLRGERDSLHRVHRPADDSAAMDGTGARRTATVVSGALVLLRARESELG